MKCLYTGFITLQMVGIVKLLKLLIMLIKETFKRNVSFKNYKFSSEKRECVISEHNIGFGIKKTSDYSKTTLLFVSCLLKC